MSDGRVTGVHRTPARGLPLVRLDEAVVREDWGVEGDRHARPSSRRQVVLVAGEVLDELFLSLAPKLAGGTDPLTILDGLPAPGGAVELELRTLHEAGGSLYLLYRIRR